MKFSALAGEQVMDDKNIPAFPVVSTTASLVAAERDCFPNVHSTGGMTLRDYFAAAALNGLLSNGGDHVDSMDDPARHAALAYRYAAAMLVERAIAEGR